MLPVLQVGPAAIQLDGLILIIGLWIGLVFSEKYSMRSGISPAQLYNLVFVIILGGLAGARLAYVLRYPQAFLPNPLSLISLNPGLLDIWGGLLASALAGLVYLQRKNIPLLAALDALTPLLAVLWVAISLSNLALGKAYGKPAELPWSIYLWGMPRHPVQLYAAMAGLFILSVTWPGRWKFESSRPGQYFMVYIAMTAFAILFLEYYRADSPLLPGGIRARQLAAWTILAACLWGLSRIRSRPTQEPPQKPL